MGDLRNEFKNPPSLYRSAPFWSWNDRLDPQELARQVADMKEHGMGGFFMHSREGLETEYMGPAWMTCVRETVKAAKTAGTYAWLYDEDRWPSGFAGGLVPARGGDAFRAKALTLEAVTRETELGGDVLAVFRATVQGDKLLKAERIQASGRIKPGPGETLLIFRREVSGPLEWFNDDAYADNLNPDSVAAFIEITYNAYWREIGSEFGQTVPGIFTDEPNIAHERLISARRWIPWTDGLDRYFASRRGYDFLDVVPYLFFEGEGSAKARHDFWWTISERFTEAYSKQLGEWCEQHGLAFTGHYLNENELGTAIARGGAIMPHYPYQGVPGIDMLCEQTHENLTVKQCTSVAHQYGRRFVLSETYGCSGWEFTFEGQKWVGDWQYVLGVSLRCPHLALYTLRGCRKRDYPPSFNYNTTWWKYNNVVEDYFARLGCVLTQGRALRDVLLIHPVATGWTVVSDIPAREWGIGSGMRRADELGEKLNRFTRVVLATHYDFDFGDEQIMAQAGRVEEGTLWVNLAPYKLVVVPPHTTTLLASTVSLLEEFVEAGGQVIAFAPVPTMIEAVPDDRIRAFWRKRGVRVLESESDLLSGLEAVLPRRVSILNEQAQQASPFLYMQRDVGGKTALYVVNNDRHSAYRVRISLEGKGRLEEWDLLTGQIRPLAAEMVDNYTYFSADFGPAGSRLYVLDPAGEPLREMAPVPQVVSTSYVGPACPFTRTDPNVLTLDVCSYRLSGGPWSEPMSVWQAQRAVREALGMRQVFYNGLPQRYKWVDKPHPNDGAPVEYRFSFAVEHVPQTQIYLLVEGAEDYTITLNGESVPNKPDGWYLDRNFDRVRLPALRQGINLLVLSCQYKERMEVEDCYILGDFGVNVDRVIVAEPERLHFGDWCLQGYLHYAGSMIYHTDLDYDPASGERVFLTSGDYSAITVAVHVNDQIAGHIPWRAANGLDITEHLRAGANRIGIEVVGSPRNMLGPLHLKAGHEPWTDWRSFRTEGERYTPDYVVHPYGLFGQVRITRQK